MTSWVWASVRPLKAPPRAPPFGVLFVKNVLPCTIHTNPSGAVYAGTVTFEAAADAAVITPISPSSRRFAARTSASNCLLSGVLSAPPRKRLAQSSFAIGADGDRPTGGRRGQPE